MKRRSLPEKILIVIGGFLKENAAIWYPYKGFGKSFRKYRGSFSKALYELKRWGYLEEIENRGERFLKLTTKGRLKLIKKKLLKKWDGQWRIIAFDIPERRRKTRDLFRFKLNELGCRPIQKSVWITPCDISSELEDLIVLLNLQRCVDYFVSQALTNEEKYLKMFKIRE